MNNYTIPTTMLSQLKSKYDYKVNGVVDRPHIGFHLTLEEYIHIFQTNYRQNKGGLVCDYTGEVMCFRGGNVASSVTLERLDDNEDYILGNVVLVTSSANKLKSTTLEYKTDRFNSKLTIDKRKMLNLICEKLFNPVELDRLKRKYLMASDNIVVDNVTTKPETPVEAPSATSKLNSDLDIALLYGRVGKSLEKLGATFSLTFTQYKQLHNKKSCMLTNIPFKKGDGKYLYVVDKTLPVTKDNVMMTTKLIAESLYEFTAKTGLKDRELIKLMNTLGSK